MVDQKLMGLASVRAIVLVLAPAQDRVLVLVNEELAARLRVVRVVEAVMLKADVKAAGRTDPEDVDLVGLLREMVARVDADRGKVEAPVDLAADRAGCRRIPNAC